MLAPQHRPWPQHPQPQNITVLRPAPCWLLPILPLSTKMLCQHHVTDHPSSPMAIWSINWMIPRRMIEWVEWLLEHEHRPLIFLNVWPMLEYHQGNINERSTLGWGDSLDMSQNNYLLFFSTITDYLPCSIILPAFNAHAHMFEAVQNWHLLFCPFTPCYGGSIALDSEKCGLYYGVKRRRADLEQAKTHKHQHQI